MRIKSCPNCSQYADSEACEGDSNCHFTTTVSATPTDGDGSFQYSLPGQCRWTLSDNIELNCNRPNVCVDRGDGSVAQDIDCSTYESATDCIANNCHFARNNFTNTGRLDMEAPRCSINNICPTTIGELESTIQLSQIQH